MAICGMTRIFCPSTKPIPYSTTYSRVKILLGGKILYVSLAGRCIYRAYRLGTATRGQVILLGVALTTASNNKIQRTPTPGTA